MADEAKNKAVSSEAGTGEEKDLPTDFWDEEEIEEEDLEGRIELLCFMVGDEEYAFNVFEVREIIRYQTLTPIPRCPPYMLGVISLRGQIIPTIDLRRRLGLGDVPLDQEPMIVVIKSEEEAVGFLVESISGITTTLEQNIESTPDVVPPDKAEFLQGVFRHEERLIAILNTERLLDVSGDFRAGES